MMKNKWTIALTVAACIYAAQADASSMVYRGSNPGITPTANPFNETAISNRANLTRPKDKSSSTRSARLTKAELLEQSVISGLSSNYLTILTGTNSGSGTLNFGDGSFADYSTENGIRTIVFRNTITGETTTISFPIN